MRVLAQWKSDNYSQDVELRIVEGDSLEETEFQVLVAPERKNSQWEAVVKLFI